MFGQAFHIPSPDRLKPQKPIYAGYLTKLVLLLLFCSVSIAANDFSGDANCKALWKFDNGALTVDSISTNTLTNNNVTNSTITKKEGDASAYVDALTDYLQILNGNMSADNPLRDDAAVHTFSICRWFYCTGFPSSGTRKICIKGTTGASNATLYMQFTKATNWTFRFGIGHTNGTGWEEIDHGTAVVINRWYHVGFTYNVSDRAYRIRIWDDTAGALFGSELTGNFTNDLYVSNATFGVVGGIGDAVGSYQDECVLFNDVLTADEIDQIRAGTYSVGPAVSAQLIFPIEEDE